MFRIAWEEKSGDCFLNEGSIELDVSAEEAKEECMRGFRLQMSLFDDWDRDSDDFVSCWNDTINGFSCWVEEIEDEDDEGVMFWAPSDEELEGIGWEKV